MSYIRLRLCTILVHEPRWCWGADANENDYHYAICPSRHVALHHDGT